MREHRLIERMVNLLQEEFKKGGDGTEIDPDFIATAVDFFKVYADRTHHGKEEDILFRELSDKDLSQKHKEMMNQLLEDHRTARKLVGAIAASNHSYINGEAYSQQRLKEASQDLVELYTTHIHTEDKEFFYPIMDYFTEEEQDNMLQEFWDFDKHMTHERYNQLVERCENKED
jgi:hemerythrin-like domain-containing protein